MKNSRITLFFRASASCSEILNNKKYIFSTVNSGHPLFFRASSSCSQQNVKTIFNTVKTFWATVFQGKRSCSKILNTKKYIQCSENFQGKLCFQGKRKLLKILNVKNIFTTVKIARATLFFFQGKRKFLKNREL